MHQGYIFKAFYVIIYAGSVRYSEINKPGLYFIHHDLSGFLYLLALLNLLNNSNSLSIKACFLALDQPFNWRSLL